jgi:polyvinyl alcohol dehydrogenase (cytochrome)
MKFFIFLFLIAIVFANRYWKQPHSDLFNNGFSHDPYIRKCNVNQLQLAWNFTSGDVSCVPTVATVNGIRHVFFTDWYGDLWALNGITGSVIWKRTISSYTNETNNIMKLINAVNGPTSRSSPTFLRGMIFIGDQLTSRFYAINAATGDLIWSRLLDTNIASMITQSPAAYCDNDGCNVIVGVSSAETVLPLLIPYYKFSFRGSVYSLDAYTGNVNWRTFTIDDSVYPDFTGVSSWGTSAAIDLEERVVYVVTGNNYNASNQVEQCIANLRAQNIPTGGCSNTQKNRVDSIIALDLDDGSIIWTNSPLNQSDIYNNACFLGPNPDCLNNSYIGEDGDFSEGVVYHLTGRCRIPSVSATSKTGHVFTLNARTGEIIKDYLVGTASPNGATWGACSNGRYLVTLSPNAAVLNYTLINGRNTTLGIWTGIDLYYQRISWQTPDKFGGHSAAAVSCTQQVVFIAASGKTNGRFYALDISTGETLWTHDYPAISIGGPSIVDGYVYFPYGYNRYVTPKLNNTGGIMAFKMPCA